MSTVAVAGGEIYFELAGRGNVVVLAHGVGGNHAIWFQQIPALSEHYCVVTFDHRGFGLSIDSAGHGRSMFVQDLRAILDYLEVDRAALIGQSMGGGTCLGFAHLYPDRTRALVLCDTLHGFVEPTPVRVLMDAARAATDELSQLERVLGDSVRLRDRARATLYLQINSFNATNRKNLKGQFAPLVEPAEIADIGVPILFLVGEEDALFPASAVRAMHQQVKGSRFVELKKCGHSAFYEDPQAFNFAVMAFLETV